MYLDLLIWSVKIWKAKHVFNMNLIKLMEWVFQFYFFWAIKIFINNYNLFNSKAMHILL